MRDRDIGRMRDRDQGTGRMRDRDQGTGRMREQRSGHRQDERTEIRAQAG